MALPRDRKIVLNVFELGWLWGALSSDKKTNKRMAKEVPALWLQLQIEVLRSYANGDHPAKESAKKDMAHYQGHLDELLEKEKQDEDTKSVQS